MDIYGDPEKFGLKLIDTIDDADACYDFDMLGVWQNESGDLFTGTDSGCSCPSPFEGQGLADLTPLRSLAELDRLLSTGTRRDPVEKAEMLRKVRSAMRAKTTT